MFRCLAVLVFQSRGQGRQSLALRQRYVLQKNKDSKNKRVPLFVNLAYFRCGFFWRSSTVIEAVPCAKNPKTQKTTRNSSNLFVVVGSYLFGFVCKLL
jgi:hypothetical protein